MLYHQISRVNAQQKHADQIAAPMPTAMDSTVSNGSAMCAAINRGTTR
jgi:hypothetical protein